MGDRDEREDWVAKPGSTAGVCQLDQSIIRCPARTWEDQMAALRLVES